MAFGDLCLHANEYQLDALYPSLVVRKCLPLFVLLAFSDFMVLSIDWWNLAFTGEVEVSLEIEKKMSFFFIEI